MPSQPTNSGKKWSTSLDAPSYSRPAQVEPGIPPSKGIDAVNQGCRYIDPTSEGPVFARPTKEEGKPMFHFVENTRNVAQTGE